MVKADDDQDMNLEYKWTGLFVQSIILILISCYHPVAMATIRCVSLKLIFRQTIHDIRIYIFLNLP